MSNYALAREIAAEKRKLPRVECPECGRDVAARPADGGLRPVRHLQEPVGLWCSGRLQLVEV